MSALLPFTRRVLLAVEAIPAGRVSTYGDIAAAAEQPRAARQVVRALHSLSDKHALPWWRVVNASGRIALAGTAAAVQRLRLEDEGVEVDEAGRLPGFLQLRIDVTWLAAEAAQRDQACKRS